MNSIRDKFPPLIRGRKTYRAARVSGAVASAYQHAPFPADCTPAAAWAHYDTELDKINAHFAALEAERKARARERDAVLRRLQGGA